MVWTCGQRTKEDGAGAARLEEKRKNGKGCIEGGHVEGWWDRRGDSQKKMISSE